MKPTIGRTVHFVEGQVHHAAIVTWVWGESVNLYVLPNGVTRSEPFLRTSVPYVEQPPSDPGPTSEYSWHWPERDENEGRTVHEIALGAVRRAGL